MFFQLKQVSGQLFFLLNRLARDIFGKEDVLVGRNKNSNVFQLKKVIGVLVEKSNFLINNNNNILYFNINFNFNSNYND